MTHETHLKPKETANIINVNNELSNLLNQEAKYELLSCNNNYVEDKSKKPLGYDFMKSHDFTKEILDICSDSDIKSRRELKYKSKLFQKIDKISDCVIKPVILLYYLMSFAYFCLSILNIKHIFEIEKYHKLFVLKHHEDIYVSIMNNYISMAFANILWSLGIFLFFTFLIWFFRITKYHTHHRYM